MVACHNEAVKSFVSIKGVHYSVVWYNIVKQDKSQSLKNKSYMVLYHFEKIFLFKNISWIFSKYIEILILPCVVMLLKYECHCSNLFKKRGLSASELASKSSISCASQYEAVISLWALVQSTKQIETMNGANMNSELADT